MPTQEMYFKGKAKWAKLLKPDQKYGNYQITVELTDKSLKEFVKSKLQLTIKGDNEVTFKRPPQKLIKGEMVEFGKPRVLSADGEPFPIEKYMIGNGSDVTVKVMVYDTLKGKGHRLEAVRVDNLIEYKKEGQDENNAF